MSVARGSFEFSSFRKIYTDSFATLTAASACSLMRSSAVSASLFHVGIQRNNEHDDLVTASTAETSDVATDVKSFASGGLLARLKHRRWR